jgi:hypothetical protein
VIIKRLYQQQATHLITNSVSFADAALLVDSQILEPPLQHHRKKNGRGRIANNRTIPGDWLATANVQPSRVGDRPRVRDPMPQSLPI